MRFENACVRMSHIFMPIRNHFEFAPWILIWVFISIIVTVSKKMMKAKWREEKNESLTEKKKLKANNGCGWNSVNVVISANVKRIIERAGTSQMGGKGKTWKVIRKQNLDVYRLLACFACWKTILVVNNSEKKNGIVKSKTIAINGIRNSNSNRWNDIRRSSINSSIISSIDSVGSSNSS